MSIEAEVEGIGVGVSEDGEAGGAPAVVLRADDRLLPIFVSPDQAQSTQHALEGVPFERPLTHDLLVEMLTDFGGAFDSVRIDDLSDGVFYAKIDAELYDEGDRQKFVFDARPSDAIAIAVRVDCPILVSEEVLEEAGRDPEEFQVGPPDPDDSEDLLGGGS